MTTIVVVRKGDTAVLAADSLTTFGTTRLAPAYDRHPQKVLVHGDSFIGIAGSAAHQLVLENLVARVQDLDFHGKAAIYESFRKLHPLLKDEAFLNPKEEEDDPYESSQMTVMIANPSGIFAVYSMREVFEFDRFWAIGSGRGRSRWDEPRSSSSRYSPPCPTRTAAGSSIGTSSRTTSWSVKTIVSK